MSKRNRYGTVQYGSGGVMVFRVRVLEVKLVFGHTRYLVTPVAGSGQCYTQDVLLEPVQARPQEAHNG